MLRFSDLIEYVMSDYGIIIEIIRPIERASKLRKYFPNFEKWFFYIDKYLFFPFELMALVLKTRVLADTVYHITDHSNAIYSLLLHNRPLLVTCHDVLAIRSAKGEMPQNPIGVTGKILQKSILYGLKKVKRIVCVSKKTESDLRRLIGNRSSKITTVLNPLNFKYHPIPKELAINNISILGDSVANAVRDGFILHVGGNQWYKNRIGACNIYIEMAHERLRRGIRIPHLILAGKEPSEEIKKFISENSDLPIHIIASPGTEELQSLYSLASMLLFPSLEEGFGWPILEAMACGCPVVTSGRPPMTEVGGEAAIYIDPLKISEAAHILNEVLVWSVARRQEQVQKGVENLRRFSREKFTDHYLNAYQEALLS